MEKERRSCAPVERLNVCGVPVVSCGPEAVLSEMDLNIRTVRKQLSIAVTNTESMYYATRRKEHLDYIRNASFSVCDGMGVVIAGRLNGRRIARLNGPVLMEKCCEYGVERGWRHYFYGGKPGVPETLRENLTRRYPGLITAGKSFSAVPGGRTGGGCRSRGANQCRPAGHPVGGARPAQARAVDRTTQGQSRCSLDGWGGRGVRLSRRYREMGASGAIRAIGLEWLYRLAYEPRMFKRVVRSFQLSCFKRRSKQVLEKAREARGAPPSSRN